jgi:hypothetical protein
MSQARLGVDHPDTVDIVSHRAPWVVEDNNDNSSDAFLVNTSNRTEKRDDDNDENDDGEAGRGETDEFATSTSVGSLNGSLLESTENRNMWNHPQFLWLL